MKIIPAIDIRHGNAVRLYQGDFSKATVYAKDPIEVAKHYAKHGVEYLHIVDLDGAQDGTSLQTELILELKAASGLSIQVGGGIRHHHTAKALLTAGVDRIVIGSLAVIEPHLVKAWLDDFGADRIVLALDVQVNEENIPYLATHGWQKESKTSLWRLLKKYEGCGLQHVLCTDIERDGTLQGPNVSLYERCVQAYPYLQFQASGGIGQLADIVALHEVNVQAAIVGKALFEKQFTLEEALDCVS